MRDLLFLGFVFFGGMTGFCVGKLSFFVVVQSRMEMVALKGSSRPEMGQQHGGFLADEIAWAVERGNFLSDEFSVDDLLDLGADEVFDDMLEKELGHAVKQEPEVEDETENSNSSSGLSFEAPIPSEIALPVSSMKKNVFFFFIIS